MNQKVILASAMMQYMSFLNDSIDEETPHDSVIDGNCFKKLNSPLNVLFHRMMKMMLSSPDYTGRFIYNIDPEYEIKNEDENKTYRVDFAISADDMIKKEKIILCFVEIDGFNYRDRNREQFNYERKRQNVIVSTGITLFRFTYDDIVTDLFRTCCKIWEHCSGIIFSKTLK